MSLQWVSLSAFFERGDLAAAEIQIAPVITPGTLDALAGSLRRQGGNGRVQGILAWKFPLAFVIAQCFLPITEVRTKSEFLVSFRKLARRFHPYRLAINFHIVSLMGPELFFECYPEILEEIAASVLAGADEKGFSSSRLRGILAGYTEYFQNLVEEVKASPADLHIDPKGIEAWLSKATEFDYALTAVFLVLEGVIQPPTASLRAVFVEIADQSLGRLRDSNPMRKEYPSASNADRLPERTIYQVGPKTRERELRWLEQNKGRLEQSQGMWLVIEGDELVARDASYEKARAIAVEKGIRRPFIIKIPSKSGAFMGI